MTRKVRILKRVIRSHNSKDRQLNSRKKKGQTWKTMINKTQHSKQKIEQRKHISKFGKNIRIICTVKPCINRSLNKVQM